MTEQTMSKEKQIEEISKILCGMKNGCDGCMFSKVYCNERNYAEEIYNAGYRKQSEGEWIWKSNGYMKRPHCSCCDKPEDWEKSYCPNCGAKMKGGGE